MLTHVTKPRPKSYCPSDVLEYIDVDIASDSVRAQRRLFHADKNNERTRIGEVNLVTLTLSRQKWRPL